MRLVSPTVHVPPLRLPLPELIGLSLALLRGERRSLRNDSAAVVGQLQGRWTAGGLEHVPPAGPVCLVVNHWQRPGLWIGWGGSLLGWLVSQRRPAADPPVHWLVLTELRLRVAGHERHLAPLDLFLHRVAHAWQMAPLSVGESAAGTRATALRRLRDLAAQGRVVGFFPEGHQGSAGPLGDPLPSAERFLEWLAQRGVALVPAALWEEDRALHARFGPPIAFARQAERAAQESVVMPALAQLLPLPLRGRWG